MDADAPLIVIPDTHGHLRVVERLYAKLRHEGYLDGHRLAFLGDYVDRGPQVRELLEWCVEMQTQGHIFIMGNHDYKLWSMLDDPETDQTARLERLARWILLFQSWPTLVSFGVERREPKDYLQALSVAIGQRVLGFLTGLPLYHETDSLLLIHAGLNPDLSTPDYWRERRAILSERSQYPRLPMPPELGDHTWANDICHSLPKTLVTGHAPTRNFRPEFYPRRVLLNTVVEQGGPLVAWISDLNLIVSVDRR